MIAGNENRSWPVIQSTAVLVTRRVPLSVWAICDANVCLSWLQTGEVVAVRARTITAICFLRFIFSPLVDSIFSFVVLALLAPRREKLFQAVHLSTARDLAGCYAKSWEGRELHGCRGWVL